MDDSLTRFSGESMYPLIDSSKSPTVLIKYLEGEEKQKLSAGDIILFSASENKRFVSADGSIQTSQKKILIMHCILKIENRDGKLKFLTIGDNNDSPDINWIGPEDIMAVAVGIIW